MEPSSWIPFLVELADLADGISLRYFQSQDLQVEAKPDRSLVTKADLEVESAIRDRLRQRFPELGMFGEEHGEQAGSSERRLIVDPIDATANFARGLPVYATLLAIEADGDVVAGMVSAPALQRRWHAARGAGAWQGQRRLQVSRVQRLADAQLFHGSLAGIEATDASPRITALLQQSWRQRGFGDFYQHVLVAEGCGEIAIDPVVKVWDVAPLQVLLEEAGGRATTLTGERTVDGGTLLSSNGQLHDQAVEFFADDDPAG